MTIEDPIKKKPTKKPGNQEFLKNNDLKMLKITTEFSDSGKL